jgi:hypothetical protein
MSFCNVLQEAGGRFGSNAARSAAGNNDATATFRNRWRVINECVEVVPSDFRLKQAYECFSVHDVSVAEDHGGTRL